MFRSNHNFRYLVDEEGIRLQIVQYQKELVLQISSEFIASNHTPTDKQTAISKLEAVRTTIMDLFSKEIIQNLP